MGQSLNIEISEEGSELGEKLKRLPDGPGVYQHKDSSGKTLYVGKAKNLRSRVRQYFQKTRHDDPRLEAMLSKVADVEVIVTDSEVEALILEANLIKRLKPRYNVTLKDDKSYPYIVITNEPFPRVFVTRQIRKDGSRYFGPYTDVKNVRAALKSVRDIFMIRSCNYHIDDEVIRKRKIKICLDYHIRKCEGPCEGLVSQEHYGSMIDQVASLLEGKTGALIERLEKEMDGLAGKMRFEEAALLRDRIKGLRAYSDRQKVVTLEETDRDIVALAIEEGSACGVVFKVREGKMIGRHHYYMSGVNDIPARAVLEAFLQQYYLSAGYIPPEVLLPEEVKDEPTFRQWFTERSGSPVRLYCPTDEEDLKLIRLAGQNAKFLLDDLKLEKMKRAEIVPHSVSSLQKDLRMEILPRRIECFDISNIQGSDTVASLVVFVDGKPKKSQYRKFRIRESDGPDDFAGMREVVHRRYRRVREEGGELPDLIIIDGGKGQLSSAVSSLESLEVKEQNIIGLAKCLEEVFMPGRSEPVLLPKASTSLQLLQKVRDEAHRFAVTYHRTVRSKRTLQTELDLIRGIGKKRAKELLEAFGSVQGVKFATEEQLSEIVGSKVAERILEHFHTSDMEADDSSG